ncbi:aminodeoxychorismate synthase component I [Fodinibius salsisoli]|uniref:aminodeoxychorismate synthase n=1 Tax=Fodinibius salsisoli TaxID=2820877 RepID=A0ABT3PN52_9BACT|nr:aminodeoxychorismate synthase component I [Fodinibius salsisoli]MCW9707153.1 aminodeoxychorismate synthase component I [Fodinibius salsisoli]
MDIDLAVLSNEISTKGSVILLESQSQDHPWSQYSFLASQPKTEIKAYGNEVHLIEDGEKYIRKGNPWKFLQEFRDRHHDWLFGYLGYDLKNHLELLHSQNSDPIGAPDLYFMVPELILRQHRKSLETRTIKGELPHPTGEAAQGRFKTDGLTAQTSRDEYLDSIKKAQQAIREGEYYEINLSHQMKGGFRGNPWSLYQTMKEIGPVPFGAFLKFDDLAVCCQSPERFLRKDGEDIFTQPIKGTSPRGDTESEDQRLKEQLAASVKERAENLMIVDLVRNDLSRIARKGSVAVSDLFKIETFGTVHQMVSTVKAKARQSDPIQILKACFPMGSMTGAPKISAMQSIETLENYKRGIYSGAVGYIKPNGDFDFNVVIRTAIIQDENLYYAVGGAITGDSDPDAEWEETLVKARALQEAIPS